MAAILQTRDTNTQVQPPSLLKPGVSELLIPAWEQSSLELVLPMLAHLSHQAGDRWLTWIGNASLSKQAVSQHRLNGSNLRMIQSGNDDETRWMMWDALNNGTSAFVVACFENTNSVTEKERQLLENACHNGYSRALVVKMPKA